MAYPNLVAEMRRTGLTNRDLAEVTEKSKDTITNWLNGKGDFPIGLRYTREIFPGPPDLIPFQYKANTANY